MTVGVQRSVSSQVPPRDRAELILGHLDRLPALPPAAARIFTSSSSDDTSIRELIPVIESDPSFTACILRMVSRAECGTAAIRGEAQPRAAGPRGGMTIERALDLLGVRAVRNAAMFMQILEILPARGEEESAIERRRGLWEHSLAVGCAAEMIAERTVEVDARGEAFACGLLHDIGKIALDVCFPRSYARVFDRSGHRQDCLCDVEREVLGLDHTFAGKRLATKWRLGRPIVETVWLHHQNPDALPSTTRYARLVRIVHVADALIRRAGIGASGSTHETDIEAAASALGLDAAILPELIERVPERMKPLQGALRLEDDANASRLESIFEANRRLRQLNAHLAESNRTLKLRSDCLEAISAFTARLNEHDRVADVCAAAAGLVCSLLNIDRALGFARMAPSRCLHVGASDKTKADCRLSIPSQLRTSVDCRLTDEPTDLFETKAGCAIFPASEGCEAVWQRCFGSPAESPLWLLPVHGFKFQISDRGSAAAIDTPPAFGHEQAAGLPACGQVWAGVLFAADEDVVLPFRSAVAECAFVSAAIGRALSSAAARVVAEETTDELLDLNRRLHTAQGQLVRMRSVSMIAEMAAGAAHELNNPLAVISGRAQMGLAKCEDPGQRRELEIIVGQARRASEIVSDLMKFAKPEAPQAGTLRLGEVLESACQHWQSVFKLGPEQLVLIVNDADATVYCDRDQLTEFLQAVFSNAVEATEPAARRIQINSPSRATDERVRIVVSDNGVGMTPEVLEHALDPFFSSRPAGRGRGLGLSRAYRLAEINGGRLWLESTHQRGTKVTIELPAKAPRA